MLVERAIGLKTLDREGNRALHREPFVLPEAWCAGAHEGYYDLHPVVREYAYAKLLQKVECHNRLVEYFRVQSNLNLHEETLMYIKKLRVLFPPKTIARIQNF